MKFLGRLIVIFSLLFMGICASNNFIGNYPKNYLEAKTVYLRTALTGGGEALDGIDGSLLSDGDVAFVMYSSVTYFYLLDADSGAGESSPDIIAPNTNPGNKRWILQGSTATGGGGSAPSNAHYYTNQVESGLSAEVVPAPNVITLLTATDYADFRSKLGLGTMAVETATNYVPKSLYDAYSILMATTDDTPIALSVTEQTLLGRKTGGAIAALSGADALLAMGITPLIAELDYVDGVTSPIQTQLDAMIPKSTIVAAGDVLVGTGAATPGVITKGANNTIFGVSNAGALGFFGNLSQVLVAAPAVDDTYSATAIATFVAGETLLQWDLVYCKNKAGVDACYKYDANGTDKAEPPRAVATAAISADAAGVFCIGDCIVRHDGWTAGQAGATNTNEGQRVYASNTPGEITITEPSTDGVVVGTLIEEKVVHFKFKNDGASTGYGAPVKQNSPTFLGKLTTAASATGGAGLNLPAGTAPSSPVDGDCWTTTAGLYCRINGATVGPYGTGGGGSPALDDVTDPDAAKTFTLLDNNASALSFGSTGKADILKIITTDTSEGVTMSGTLGVTGTITGALTGNVSGSSGSTTGNAATASALAADPANCAAGQIALGITAAGVAECTATPSGLTSIGATTFTGALTGNASSATLASTVVVVDSTDTSSYIAMFDDATGSLAIKTDAGLTYNAGTGVLTATGFSGPLTGAVTGNASTATALAANGANCNAGNYPLGVDASGAVESCTAAPTATSLHVDDILTALGIASEATHFGTFTGTTIPDNQTAKAALQALETALELKAPSANPVFTTSLGIPVNGTLDAAGEITVDTTTDQFKYYGGAARVLPYIHHSSFVIPAPAATDDINLMKAPYGMTILGIDCIVQGTTSVTGQLQECTSAGASCADLDSDIVCDADGAADDASLTDNTIASGAWIRWNTTSVSGTPTFLTVTFRYSVVAD